MNKKILLILTCLTINGSISALSLPEAAEKNDYSAVENILKKEANNPNFNINEQDSRGKTALFWAADKNNQRLAELLLKNGADPNIAGISGYFPLWFAVSGANVNFANLLLRYKADPFKKHRQGSAYDRLMHLQGYGKKWHGDHSALKEINRMFENVRKTQEELEAKKEK